ncbi:hypothetical protein E4U43_000345 [Claviceps pusilla]|uniref:Glycosyl hydrolase family 43 protein n=1 Tax=Claviceps pusilla TaxID=123648 RepID=A0A9P7NAU1_9HYPO|nr:hypothetical protein E4U43_000345 [Claviceps pusilla]
MRFSLVRLVNIISLLHGAQSQSFFVSDGNPILSNGTYYTADPAPIVVDGVLYIIAGQDTAPKDENDFTIKNWDLLASKDPNPAGGEWALYSDFVSPHSVFRWADPDAAYASQIVRGPDDAFYLYAPVAVADTKNSDPFGIGVARADRIEGPYVDHHPEGPIVSQSYPAPGNDIENIDPTVLVDNGRVFMYWGTFGTLLGVELHSRNMTSFVGDIVSVTTLNGFFEAPWLMKRGDTYYMLYAANNVGRECTPTLYHACIAYGTASSPLGPWTYRGVILGIVSSTTSHSGTFHMNDQWYLVYHTADARGGGHFRRSVAFDKMEFDDSTSPPSIRPIKQTHRPGPPPKPTYERQQIAVASSSPPCIDRYWIEAIHDQKIPNNPLPPEYWSTYADEGVIPVQSTVTYSWTTEQRLSGVAMSFYADHPAGSVEGVAPPTEWFVEYKAANGSWVAVRNSTVYSTRVTTTPKTTKFDPVKTTSLRATLRAPTNGNDTAGVGIKEWIVYSTTKAIV